MEEVAARGERIDARGDESAVGEWHFGGALPSPPCPVGLRGEGGVRGEGEVPAEEGAVELLPEGHRAREDGGEDSNSGGAPMRVRRGERADKTRGAPRAARLNGAAAEVEAEAEEAEEGDGSGVPEEEAVASPPEVGSRIDAFDARPHPRRAVLRAHATRCAC